MEEYYRGFHLEANYRKSWFGQERLYYSIVRDADGAAPAVGDGEVIDAGFADHRQELDTMMAHLKQHVDGLLAAPT